MILYEAFTTFRQIFMDGRPLPEDPQAACMGYSIGKWDGDTLVIDTSGFNDLTWLDNAGTPHGEALHVTERYHRRDIGHLDIQITVDDPETFLHPFIVTEHDHLLPDTGLLEMICSENNKDVSHLAELSNQRCARTKDGKPDMSAPLPRTKDRHTDITGIWMPNGLKYLISISIERAKEPGLVRAGAKCTRHVIFTSRPI